MFNHYKSQLVSNMSVDAYCTLNGISVREYTMFAIKLAKEVGCNTNIHLFDTYEEFKNHVFKKRQKKKEKQAINFIQYTAIREKLYYSTLYPNLVEYMSIIEDYYNPKVFTPSKIESAIILSNGKDIGNIRCGISIKKTYSNLYVVYLYGVLGEYVDEIDINGNHVGELLSGSKKIGCKKVYKELPKSAFDFQNDLLLEHFYKNDIDYQVVMLDDFRESRIYPTYNEFMETSFTFTFDCDSNGVVKTKVNKVKEELMYFGKFNKSEIL